LGFVKTQRKKNGSFQIVQLIHQFITWRKMSHKAKSKLKQ